MMLQGKGTDLYHLLAVDRVSLRCEILNMLFHCCKLELELELLDF